MLFLIALMIGLVCGLLIGGVVLLLAKGLTPNGLQRALEEPTRSPLKTSHFI